MVVSRAGEKSYQCAPPRWRCAVPSFCDEPVGVPGFRPSIAEAQSSGQADILSIRTIAIIIIIIIISLLLVIMSS